MIISDINRPTDAGEDAFRIIPALWTEDSESQFINVLKEHAHDAKKLFKDLKNAEYADAVKRIVESLSGYAARANHNQRWPGFSNFEVPGPFPVAYLENCTGYKHINTKIKSQCKGFFFRGHMDVKEDEVFQEWDLLCNEITAASYSATVQ